MLMAPSSVRFVAIAMHALSALTRLLLCLALMLDSVGTAMATARMAAMDPHGTPVMAHAMPAEPAPRAPANDEDCAHHAAGADAAQAPEPASPHAGDDCLRSCLAMCMQHCHAVAGVAVPLFLAGDAQAPATRESAGAGAQSSPPPVRPPIA